jgi:3-methyladenine DNA glycosylase AlkC
VTASQRVPLKDQLLTGEKVELIAREIEHVHPAFRADEFVAGVIARFPELELKARIEWIATWLEGFLPRDFRRAAGILLCSLPDQVLGTLLIWTEDEHYHVRRLCSEGTRPRLPWAGNLTLPYDAAIPVLDRLFSDPTRYVTRSVANHVNDISKKNPDLALDTLERWRDTGHQRPHEMGYVIRHAARTLVRTNHPRALDIVSSSRGY